MKNGVTSEMVKYDAKIVLLGEGAVGKTSLVHRYVQDTFSIDYKLTIGSNFLLKKVELDQKIRVLLQIWDLSGQDVFRTVRAQYYLFSRGAILVFDLTRRSTFQKLERWYSDLKEKTGVIPLMLFGNKSDLEDQVQVDRQQAEEMARRFNATYVETSALTGDGVEDSFTELARKIVDNIKTQIKKD